jgi:hypothetical protein
LPSNCFPYQLATPDHTRIAFAGVDGRAIKGACTPGVISKTTRGQARAAEEMERFLRMSLSGQIEPQF